MMRRKGETAKMAVGVVGVGKCLTASKDCQIEG